MEELPVIQFVIEAKAGKYLEVAEVAFELWRGVPPLSHCVWCEKILRSSCSIMCWKTTSSPTSSCSVGMVRYIMLSASYDV